MHLFYLKEHDLNDKDSKVQTRKDLLSYLKPERHYKKDPQISEKPS